jgi:DNA-binding NtrC family response regulator
VLIVEDESRLRDLLLDVVPDMGYHATAARTAQEAMRIMETDPRDILLLDLRLPVMGGMDFFQIVRNRWPDTQVIILTGFGDLDAARQAIHLDVVDFLSKPCHLKNVEIALDRARQRIMSSRPALPTENQPPPQPTSVDDSPTMTLEQTERRQILAALARNNGNRTATALELGISRRMLHYRLNEYLRQGYPVK